MLNIGYYMELFVSLVNKGYICKYQIYNKLYRYEQVL